MSHRIKPNTKYRIITVQIAVEDNSEPGTIEDGMSELLSGAIEDENTVVIDWGYTVSPENAPIVQSSSEPEEGELF